MADEIDIHAAAVEDTLDSAANAEAEAAPSPFAAEAEAAPSPFAAEIERWFVERMHNSPVSRDTEIYNHVRAAVDDLKIRIARNI